MPDENGPLEGEVIGFRYVKDDGSFAIVRMRLADGREVAAVGPLGHVQAGQHLTLHGTWEDRAMFGRQYRVRTVSVADPRTLRGIELYLAGGSVKGLGPAFARRIIDYFGSDTLRIIDDEPHRLLEVPGIGQKKVADILEAWKKDRAFREVHALLRGFGIGQALSNRIVERYGRKAGTIVREQPYRLAAEIRGVGFRTADAIAREVGIAPDHPARAEAAVHYLLSEAENDGHCFLPEAELVRRAESLSLPGPTVTAALDRLDQADTIVRHPATLPGGRPVFSTELEHCEQDIAARVRNLLRLARLPSVDTAPDEAALGIELHPQQQKAVSLALENGVSVITGGPGTGKTTIVQVLLRRARRSGQIWLLGAPTGRASRRLAEATGAEAKTLHRLLEFNPRTSEFTRNAQNPLEAEGVLIDEASMVDARLMASLLEALPDGCRLVLVGDSDQLPSVGAGRVLADLIGCGVVPVATLTEVFRQAAGSGIVHNAWRVHRGEDPVSSEREDLVQKDFFILPRRSADQAVQALLKSVTERLPKLGFDPKNDVQVLTPMHGGPLGTEALNHVLQAALNADGVPMDGKYPFRIGDRVMQTRNNYDHDVFNGDVGVVESIESGGCTVNFDGTRVAMSGPQLDDITLAYAISIHKSQGSEYPAVVMVLHRAHRIMLRRNLVYTGMTRARKFCCIIGEPEAIHTATQTRGGDNRYSLLATRIEHGGIPT